MSALQRHTIHNALTHLSPEERQVVNLAYLEGRTNRQIAAVLGVSVSTVRRRLWLALDHLDEYVRRTGTWVSSILLLGLVYLIDRAARLGRSASPGEWPHKLAATVAVGTVAAAGVGLVAANQHSSTSQHSPPPAIARLIPSLPGATNSLTTLLPLAPGTAAPITPSIAAVHSSTTPAAKVIKAASNTNNRSRQGDSTSEQSDQVDKSAPVVTVKSDSDRGPAANRSKRGHSRVMTGEDRSDT